MVDIIKETFNIEVNYPVIFPAVVPYRCERLVSVPVLTITIRIRTEYFFESRLYLESVHKVGSFSLHFSFDCFSMNFCP